MNKKGIKGHDVTEKNKQQVEIMTACGITYENMARVLGISVNTLQKYYQEELKVGATKANSKVASAILKAAVNGNMTAAIWWTKTRMNWSERQEHEISGKDGKEIKTVWSFEGVKVTDPCEQKNVIDSTAK